MIKFFRKIRLNFLSEGRTKRYLTYAIGEIVLVVVGILIALQINNWNGHRREREMEEKYLSSLHTEFSINLEKVNTSIREATDILQDVNRLLVLFDKSVLDTVTTDSVDVMLQFLGQIATYEPSRGVLNDIISSGNLNLITSQELRQRLASFESLLEYYKRQENGGISRKQKIKEIFFKRGSLKKIAFHENRIAYHSYSEKVNNKLLFDSVEFENYLFEYALVLKSLASDEMFLGTIRKEIETILKEIEQELS
ncbi:DUF6090 family protein [Portibacter marinus]|uniref:DUF6090 family protein n=1 Tax=Portibacter marinus TaxID=2898660 RepID=UPI001F389459|nr:DUF6090 family protein [Portibacter marinus]